MYVLHLLHMYIYIHYIHECLMHVSVQYCVYSVKAMGEVSRRPCVCLDRAVLLPAISFIFVPLPTRLHNLWLWADL